MKHIIFDIEANGLGEVEIDKKKQAHPECDLIHCLVLRSFPDDEVRVFRHNNSENTIAEGWAVLQSAETVIGHNIIQYDLPILRRLYFGDVTGRIYDTLVAARTLWPDAKNHPWGGNSLKAFGLHLGAMKIGLDIEDWSQWTQEMEDRCVQDTLVSRKVFDFIAKRVKERKQQTPVKIEHLVATICAGMQDNGISINLEKADDLIESLEVEQARCEQALQEVFPPRLLPRSLKKCYWWDPEKEQLHEAKSKAPKAVQKRLVKTTHKIIRIDEQEFNPGSAKQVAERLKELHGWDAPLTDAGNPSVTEEILKTLDFPEVEPLLKATMIDKRLQHLVDWTTRARMSRTPGRIHPQINPCGCNTSRASHKQPNQTACPKVLTDTDGNILHGYEGRWGWEMRELWGPREGWVQVGGDASGIELRCLGHALYPYDNGAYAHEVINGDVHQKSADAVGLTRNDVKTPTYATLYGAGDGHLDTLCKGKVTGKEFRKRFEGGIKGFSRLKTWCMQCASERGWIPMIDGRRAPVRSEHSALNVLLQGLGAIIMKTAMCILYNRLKKKGWLGTRCAFMLWPHDEFQLESEPEIADEVGQMIVDSIIEAGKRLGIKCPLDGEYKVGANWAETH